MKGPEASSPRQQIRRTGPFGLSEAELLSVLIQRSRLGWREALDTAEQALARLPAGLASLREATALPSATSPYLGLDPWQTATVAAALELGTRASEAEAEDRWPRLSSPEEIIAFVLAMNPGAGGPGGSRADSGLLVLGIEGSLLAMQAVPVVGDSRPPLIHAYQMRAATVVLWLYRGTAPEIRPEDRACVAVLLEGCQWLGLELQALIIGPGGQWLPLAGLGGSIQ